MLLQRYFKNVIQNNYSIFELLLQYDISFVSTEKLILLSSLTLYGQRIKRLEREYYGLLSLDVLEFEANLSNLNHREKMFVVFLSNI